MSGSLTSIYESVGFALYLHNKAMIRLQEQAATGSRVNRVSDDPSDAYRILGLNSQQLSLEHYTDILTQITGSLEITSTVVEDMVEKLGEVKANLTQVLGGTHGDSGRLRLAESIDGTLEQLVSLANTKHAGQYIFGGSDTAEAPYLAEYCDGQIVGVTYQGSDQPRSVEVAPGLHDSVFCVGRDVFHSDSRAEPVFLGGSGAKGGTGTSSVRGDVWLTVTHDGTNYRLSIDDGATSVAVPVGGHTNQAVTDSRTGQVLYVDTTGINSTGVELVRVPGTYDVFGTLISIRDILRNERDLSDGQLSDLQDGYLDAVEEVRNLLVQAGVSVGSRIGFLEELKGNIENIGYDTEDETTRLQQADIAQVAIDLSRREILYEMSLSVAGRLLSTSLLDYLQ